MMEERVSLGRQDMPLAAGAFFIGAVREADEEVVFSLADVAAVERSRRNDLAELERSAESRSRIASTSPSRLGAPGRVKMAPRRVSTAVSSTKVESGKPEICVQRVDGKAAILQRLAIAGMLLARDRHSMARRGRRW